MASFQETLEKFKARLAVVRDPARQAQRMKEAREAAARMPKPEEFVASIAESIRIEEASLVEELGPKGSSSKGLAAAQKVLDEIAAWLAELSPADRAAPACFAAEAKRLRARFRPGLAAGCTAIVRPNYQYFNAALPRSAPQVLSITPVARCFDTANKYNAEATSKSPAGCAANRSADRDDGQGRDSGLAPLTGGAARARLADRPSSWCGLGGVGQPDKRQDEARRSIPSPGVSREIQTFYLQ